MVVGGRERDITYTVCVWLLYVCTHICKISTFGHTQSHLKIETTASDHKTCTLRSCTGHVWVITKHTVYSGSDAKELGACKQDARPCQRDVGHAKGMHAHAKGMWVIPPTGTGFIGHTRLV